MKRGSSAYVEDRWHRPARRGEAPPYPADNPVTGCWCMDARHGVPGTLVTTTRHGSGLRWQARWVDNDGNERSKACTTKELAKSHTRKVIADLQAGTYADPQRSAVTFGTIAETWLEIKEGAKRAPKTIAGYRGLLDVVILPKWKDEPLRDITHERLQTWVTWLATDPSARKHKKNGDESAGLSPARVIQTHQVMSQVLTYAMRTKYIAANPADHIELPRKAKVDRDGLTYEQVAQLAKESGDVGIMVRTLAFTGIRFGECVALRVRDVDPDSRRIHVSRSITGVRGKGRLEGPTKTHQERKVPILNAVLNDDLRMHIAGRDPSEFLFPGRDGGSMSVGWFRVRFDKATAKLNMQGVTPHTLRHAAGSLALASGASVVVVQKLLGHLNATTTMNVYSHKLPDDFDNLAAAMDLAAGVAANPKT